MKDFLAAAAPWLAALLMGLFGWQLRTYAVAVDKVIDRQTQVELSNAELRADIRVTKETVLRIEKTVEELRR